MKKIIKFSIGLLLALVLMVSAPVIGFTGAPEIAMAAAASTPKTTVSKVTLYIGYKTYQIKFENLSKNAAVTFKSSNAKIAKVSNSGIITPVAKGSATVTVTMKQNNKTYTNKIAVTINLSNIKFSNKTSTLIVGDTFTFKAAANGTNSKISWSVSNKSIGKIDSKSGKFTALKKGEVDVIATAGSVSSRCTVTVSDPKLTTASKNITCYEETIIYIRAADLLSNENLIFSIGDDKIVGCYWGDWEGDEVALLIDPIAVGSTKVTVTSSQTSDKLVINVTVIKKPDKRDPGAKELTAKEIYSKAAPATVELQVTKPDGEYISSGFFIYSGILITNYHAIEGATKITVITNRNKQYEISKILGYDEKYDIAVLSINAVTEHLRLYYGDITVGEKVYALGSPRGLTGSLSDGIVSSASRIIDGVEYIQVTAPISNGNSGGPLINAYGEVVGINTFIILDSQNLNFAVNVYQYMKLNFNNAITANEFYKASADKVAADQYGSTVGNIVNGGWVVERDGWIYFVNENDDSKLYKMDTAGEGLTKLSDDRCWWINVLYGWVYYCNVSDDAKLYKMRIDGTGRTKISDDDCRIINVVDGWAYYNNANDGFKIYKIRTDGTERTKLIDNECWSLNVVNGWVYYVNGSDNGKLYKIRTDRTEQTKLSDDECDCINVVDGWVYYVNYSDGERLYKVRIDGTNRTKLNNDPSKYINVADGWVYYCNGNDGGKIYRIRTDGTEQTKYKDEKCRLINVTNSGVYYYYDN